MAGYYIRRVLVILPTLFVVILITFVIMHATPGGPFDTNPDSRTNDPRVQDRLMKAYGLDKPLFLNTFEMQQSFAKGENPIVAVGDLFDGQFEAFLINLAQFKLGPSYRYRGLNVEDVLFQSQDAAAPWQSRFGATFILGVVALIIALVIGFPLGLIAALKQNTWVDTLSLFFATIGVGVPNFVSGIVLIIIFAAGLGWFKVVENDYWTSLKPWILPAFVLALPTTAFLARLTRSSMLEVMRMDFVRTARAKGLNERAVIGRHMIKNALIPVITFLGPALAALTTGSFVIEYQFNVSGIGLLFVESIGKRDYGIIMGLTIIYATFIAVANLSVDIIYGYLDPRIRLGRS